MRRQRRPHNGHASLLPWWTILFLVSTAADTEEAAQTALCPPGVSECGESHEGYGQQMWAQITGSQ